MIYYVGTRVRLLESSLRVISKKKLRDFYDLNPQAKIPLVEWYMIMRQLTVHSFQELKNYFNTADYTNGYTIFDIGGNNYRLITAIHYNRQICYIRNVWTHAEYSKSFNQGRLHRGTL